MKIRNQLPKGGTELQFEYLEKTNYRIFNHHETTT